MGISKRMAGIAGALALGLALVGCSGTATTAAQEHMITVNATATVMAVPDKASFYVSIVTQGETAEEASAANAAPTNAVIDALKAAGVAEEDIQTNYTDLSPVYGFAEEPASDVAYLYGGNDIVGYEMRTSIQVTGADIDEVSALMGACIAAGATGVDGPRYYVSSYDEAYSEALEQAIAASREKAQVMASAAGVSLGNVINITEGYSYTGLRYAATEASYAMDADGGVAEMEISPGQVEIEAQVTVSFAI